MTQGKPTIPQILGAFPDVLTDILDAPDAPEDAALMLIQLRDGEACSDIIGSIQPDELAAVLHRMVDDMDAKLAAMASLAEQDNG